MASHTPSGYDPQWHILNLFWVSLIRRYHWGIVIPSQIAAAVALVKYWHPSEAVIWACPAIFILLTSSSVLGARIYGEIESCFALIKLFAAAVLIVIAFAFDMNDAAHKRSPFRFWDPPITQYLDIPGAKGRFLAFCAVFVQAAISFFGTEIPSVIAAELKDAPRVIYAVSKRVWLRLSILYLLAVFAAGTLVPRKDLKDQMDHLVPEDPSTQKNDAPWASSPFLTALEKAGSGYNWIANICMVCFVTSAASAASAEVFISARYLYFLAKAGHAPAFLGATWPKKPKRKDGVDDNRAVIPWVGVLATVAFATLSWLCVRPGDNTMSEMEKTFIQIESMTTSACLQAWVGTLFTYLRFWRGTCHKENQKKYKAEIERIRENRAVGQPFLAIYSFTVCSAVLIFNGWSLFNQKNATWVIFFPDDPAKFSKYQVVRFITAYAPIPVFILVLFGYKLVCQTAMIRAGEMDFSGVAGMDLKLKEPEEKRPSSFWGRVWWILVK
ncbi:hypothetical protein M407DRAFT_22736 [Tulasnella calospora MUT 4182]|uniref:Amino acid permease/ SLC12A domain-containing protein n=1 Tax=Tulasnella calospora MUT 4182 TaxID=1051891 RepID=A0A0C3QKX2_9AGAM|nr:hypothetical protein M407DRAFT_22736 [Tulasnella calospora MUT 4182]